MLLKMQDTPSETVASFRPVPRTGVIYVNEEATKRGYHADSPDWCNLGQGQPEISPLPGAPDRIRSIEIDPADHEYAPVPGLWEVREAIAELYNQLYRKGKSSQYTAENVAIASGGRAALTRVVASLGHVNLGHFLPDYTAYEELLDSFRTFTSIPILLERSHGYDFPVSELQKEILGRGLGALLLSNPCNPTGKLISGELLEQWVATARELDCAFILDEFYSNYIWNGDSPTATVSAAEYVQDVNRDPIILLNGLTKNWRYPGWRLGWVVAPKSVIDSVSSAGSFLDGGGSRPLQRAALPLLDPKVVEQETAAIHQTFSRKREYMLERLTSMGITTDLAPQGTFYAWGNLSGLRPELTSGMDFFQQALDHKVIVVPGEFFDVNPGKRRPGRVSRFRSYARFSYGPPMSVLQEGLDRLETMLS
jgi:hypothetical protein